MLGLYASPEAAMQVAALSACVRLISGNVAKLPFQAFTIRGEDRQRARGNGFETLMKRPNAWQTGFEFRRTLTAHVALYGNGYAIKKMSGARVEELIPWHPSNVKVIQDDPFAGPRYEFRSGGDVLRRSGAEVLHLRDLSLDGVVGLSRIEQAQQGISLSLAAETYATAYFLNGAEAGVALETDQRLTAEQRIALVESWKAAHQGPARAHSPTVLESGLKLKSASASNKDSQFLELRSFQVEDIARLYGVPPHLIGLTEKQTSWGTGVEQMSIGFLEFNLLDWLVMWETATKRDLLSEDPDEAVFGEHLVEGLLRADIKTRMEAYATAITNGIMNRNEVRRKENMAPYQGGDEFMTPMNMNRGPTPQVTPGPRAIAFPSDGRGHEWRKRVRVAQRAVLAREKA